MVLEALRALPPTPMLILAFLCPALEASTREIVDAYTGEIQDKLNTVKGA